MRNHLLLKLYGILFLVSIIAVFTNAYADDDDDDDSAPSTLVPMLPEKPNMSYMNPCDEFSIEDVFGLSQSHDGHTFSFNGNTAGWNEANQVWYAEDANNTYVCAANPNTDDLIQSYNDDPDSIRVWQDFGWQRVANSFNGRINQADNILDGLHNSNACYSCLLERNTHGCFPPGVSIAVDDGTATKFVEEIGVGDYLWNPVLKKSARVLRVIEGPENFPLISLGFGETVLTVSREHPILTKDGVKKAISLNLGDQVYDGQGTLHQLTTLNTLPVTEGQRVINFILDADAASGDEGRMILADRIVTGDLIIQRALADSEGE